MGIDFSKFSHEIQTKIKAALSDDKIDAAEFRAMNLEKDIANKLMQELAGNQEYLGDGYIKMQNGNKTLVLLDKPVENSFIPLTEDSLVYYRAFNKDVAQGIYKDGMLYMADSKGRPLKDKFNNYICERVSVKEYNKETQDISGNFEIIENEPPERTNRRFAVALISSMYNEVISELQTLVKQMGILDVGFWREAIGMGVQAIADLKENQELITSSTKKKIERIEKERDNICDSLSELIDCPDEFKAKFYQLMGKDYRDNAFTELREIQHDQDGKGSKTKYKECVAKFKELYPDNNISGNIENWEDSAEYQKTTDEIANIVVMLYMTGGIGKLFNGSVQTMARNILLAAAKGDKKAVMTNFAKLAPEVQTVWQSLAKKEFGVALTQTVTPMTQSAATMSSWEGIKAFLNNLTNAEDMSPEELLKRTLEGFESGAEMGVIMGGLEVAAIAPVMTKMTPVLNKLSGASAEISGLIEKGNGVVSMEKIMETYSKASETLRGKFVKEGAHTLVALPNFTVGFTVTGTAFHFDEAAFRKQLLDAATTDEERDAIMKMNSIDLRLEFAKTDFINQVKGMATIEGVGLMFRRLQAARLAGKTFNQRQRDIIGANLRPVKENGKTVYEICSSEGEVIPIKDGTKTLTRFTTIEQATAAYSVLCVSVYSEINAMINEGTGVGVKEASNKGDNRDVADEGKTNKETPQAQTYQEITYDKAVASIEKKIQASSNVSDLMPFLKAVQEKYPREFRIDKYGNLSFYDGDSKTFYSLSFDGQGNITKFSKKNYKSENDSKKDEQFYIYDKSGKQREVSRDDYHKTWSGIRTSELRNYIITNPDLLPKETRELLLQDENHYYTKEDIDELSSMLKTPDNIAIVNKLLDTRGNENRAIRAIGDALNLSQQKFGVRDIIKVLKSQDARAYVLDKIAQNKYAKKTELEPLLKGETFSALVEHKFVDEANTSYRTKDITLDKVGDVITEYQTNPQIKERINQQVPDGEAACINGKMYCRADNTLVPIQLEKATFDKLFPVEERYNIQQGKIGDCYFIAELGGYAATPNGRAALYSSFRQEGNDIIIKFPRFDNIEIKFKNGDLNKLYPVSLYKRYGQWQVGSGSAHVKACDGIKMIEQAYSFVRNNHTDENVQIVANDKFLMNKQMQELDGSRMGGGAGEVPGLFGNYECLTAYTSLGFVLDGARTVEEGLDVLAKELKTDLNVFGSVSFSEEVPIDVNDGLLRNHQYRIVGYDKNKQIVKMVNPHDSSKYMEIPLELFKAAEPSFSVFKINPPKVEGVNEGKILEGGVKDTELTEVAHFAERTGKSETPQTQLYNGKYSRPLTEYDKIGNKVFELKSNDVTENPEKIAEIKAEIENLRKTEPQKADELQIVLEMFTNPTSVHDVKDAQIDAVVNYLNKHYDNVEKYLTEQAGGIGISGENLGRFGHRIKGEWSTRDKIANYISDSIRKEKKCKEKGQAYTPRTLLDAYKDVRDKYACRTVFKNSDYTKHPEIIKILEEGKYSPEAYRKAQLRAAEIQSQPAVDMLKEAMRKAVREGKDLSMMRISNYTSEGGIPIFSEAQLAELKECGIELGIDVSFIRLASEEEPNTDKMIVDGATTKAQPSGYTALQINFVTKAGEIIEWQYRGELVNEFAEAEHLPYDLRTGKHPWRQYPELETLYKPIADLLAEKNMPKYAYDQLNRYFTDYYNHLRKLELGFESKEPKLEDYEHWKAKDKDSVEREYTFKFDKRLNAENLKKLHFYGEGIKDGTITPERALEEYNAEVRKQSDDNTTLLKTSESRVKDLSQKLKKIVGKDFALELMEIKDNDLFAFLEKELVEWDDPDSIRRILSLAKNAALFSEGGFESMDKFSQKAYETSCFWGDSIKDRIKKAEKIEDSAQRDIALAHIKMHVYSQMLMTSEVRDNMEFRNLITEKFIKPGIPETYYNAIKELEKLTGKKVYVIQDFRPTTENEYDISFANMDAWLNMSEKVKNFYRQHSDELINKYKMISKYLADEYEELSESELDAYAKKGGIEYQYSSSDTPRKILEMEESKINRIKELRQRWKNSEGEPVSSSLLEKCLEECSQEELEIIDKRQLYKIRTDMVIYLEPKYLKVLAKLNDNNWNALKKMGLFDAKNNLQLSYLKIDSDPFGNITRHDIALENLINSIEDLKNSIPVAKKFMASGYDKTESLIQAGYLVKGLNETEAAELREFNWDNAKSKYDNISRMMKAKPDKYVSGQFLSLKSIYELFTKEVLNQNYEYKRDLQNAVRSFFYENDIARCEFYSRLQQEISDKIRSNTIDISEAKEILKNFMDAKVQREEKSKNALKPEDIINDSVNEFLYKNEKRLTRLCAFMDKEAMETLLRKRFSDVEEYLDTLDTFNFADLKLLNDLSGSYNLSGKPFLPTQKMEFIDLISGYRAFGLDMSEMKQMVKEQKVDIAKLHKDLFVQIMKKIGMSDAEVASIPNEKLMTWDLKYMHLLAKEVAGDFVNLDDAMHRSTKPGDNAFADIIRNGNLKDFKKFIQDTTNIYGQTNLKTKTEYTGNNMNYDLWINPPENMNVRFKNIDKDTKVITDLSAKLLNDINILRRNNALRGIIDKQFTSCVKDNEFIIPSDCQVSAVKLKSFIEKLLKTLEPVKARALSNIDHPQRGEIARRNLATIASIESNMSTAENLKDLKASKTYDFTIKMWDRKPQHDLFQGNYSTCCIGMGGGNGSAQPHYLLNTSCNMIEIIDNVSGKTIGNALCYFGKNAEGKPIFIIDNLEINNSIKFTEEAGKDFRSAVTQYASNISRAVTGHENTEIFIGASYNDIPTNDLQVCNSKISFIGQLDCEELYLDVYSGWVNTNELTGQRKLLRLK